VYGIRGTNKYGTLSVENEIPLSQDRQIIYTSGQNGASDSFTLVYGLVNDQGLESGSYRGRIGFVLEPIDSTQLPISVVLNVLVELDTSKTVVEVTTPNNSKELILRPDKQQIDSASVFFQIKGPVGRNFRILQLVTEPPVSNDGDILDWKNVTFMGRDAKTGRLLNEITPLSPKLETLYEANGSEADSFTFDYSLADMSAKKAGIYKTAVKYILEVNNSEQRLLATLLLKVDNPRIFELIVTPEGSGVVRFTDVKPSQPAKASEVSIEVKTNTGKLYQVSQILRSELINREGNVIAPKYFTLKEESLETKGRLRFLSAVPVNPGEMVLFTSDAKGSADKFKVIYELSSSFDIRPGDYSTGLTYSISEL